MRKNYLRLKSNCLHRRLAVKLLTQLKKHACGSEKGKNEVSATNLLLQRTTVLFQLQVLNVFQFFKLSSSDNNLDSANSSLRRRGVSQKAPRY